MPHNYPEDLAPVEPNISQASFVDLKTQMRELLDDNAADQEDFEDWCNEYLSAYYAKERDAEWERIQDAAEDRIATLMGKIEKYKPTKGVPEFDITPDGVSQGIAFIYDEDNDARVLLAIDEIVAKYPDQAKDVIAISEHKGTYELWCRKMVRITSLSPGLDSWGLNAQYVIKAGEWVAVPYGKWDK